MQTDTTTQETHLATSRPRRRGWLLLIPALTVLGIAGGTYTSARAQTVEAADAGPAGGFGARRLERLLDKVGATASQRGQIEAIWAGLRPQLKSFHQQERSLHQQMRAALSAAAIDPSAVESLRQQAMGVANQMSSTFTQGLVQTAQVLTPDQRKAAAAAIDQARAGFHHHHGPGMMGQ
ncbi:MAG TPA: periplasmic heavy metal sensor [Polyangia bacterium]|jgi:Spy/CpxP family protein refolding chaperone